jgi:hypothetical protein
MPGDEFTSPPTRVNLSGSPMKDKNLTNIKSHFRTLGAILVVFSACALLITLNQWGVAYYWFLISPLFGIAFFMLAPHSWKVARVVKPWFPVASELMQRQEQVDHNISVFEKVSYTLRFYDICDSDCVEALRDDLCNSLPQVNTDRGRLENCANNAASLLNKTHAYLTPRVLMLLYQDHHGGVTIVDWAAEKTELIPGLAKVLEHSSHVQSKQFQVPFLSSDIEQLLSPLKTYTINGFKEEIEGLHLIQASVTRYLQYLTVNRINHRLRFRKPADVLDHLKQKDFPINPANLNATTLRVLTRIGKKAFQLAFPDLPYNLRKSLRRISFILFFEDDEKMIAPLCRKISQNADAVCIAFAYMEFREDLRIAFELDGQNFVSVNYLIENWARRVEEREKSLPARGLQIELQRVRQTLQDGKWVTSLPAMIKEMLEQFKKCDKFVVEMHEVVTQRPFIHESLKRVFKTLSLGTVERYLEARTIIAYLLTFQTERGTVAGLLDCIRAQEKQGEIEGLGIDLQVEGAAKYNYKQYTNSARVGIVPKGWSFEQFCAEFQGDFRKIVKARKKLLPEPSGIKKPWTFPWSLGDLKDMELIIHRFGLSGRNYYGFLLPVTKQHAIERIRELFAGILDLDDLNALIYYEKDAASITEAIMNGSIAELIDPLTLTPPEKKVFDRKDVALQACIFTAVGVRSAKELGHYLLEGDQQRLEAAAAAAGGALALELAGALPIIGQARCRMIAVRYLETLKAMAAVET